MDVNEAPRGNRNGRSYGILRFPCLRREALGVARESH